MPKQIDVLKEIVIAQINAGRGHVLALSGFALPTNNSQLLTS